MKTTPETLYLAQLLDQRASEVRRTAVPIEAMTGEWRDVYRAIVAVSHGSDVVAVEAVISELREMGRLDNVGGARGACALRAPRSGPGRRARAELVEHAAARVIADTSLAQEALQRMGEPGEAAEEMRAALRLLGALAGDKATPLKSMREHVADWTRAQLDPQRARTACHSACWLTTSATLRPATWA